MTNLRKFTIAYILYGSFWWGAIGPLYFLWRGLSMEELYALVAVYSLAVVLAEFPTGVLADRFSRKWSVIFGVFLLSIGNFLTALPGDFHYYLTIKIFMAIGTGMVSGSDVALLYGISDNFKRDYAKLKKYNFFFLFFFINAGTLAYRFLPWLPFVLSALSMLVAVFFYWGIKVKEREINKEEGDDVVNDNVYKLAIKSIREISKKKILRKIVILSTFFTGAFLNIKWFMAPLLDNNGIAVEEVGFIMSLGMVIMGGSAWIKEREIYWGLKYDILILLVVFGLLGFVNGRFMLLVLFALLFFARASFKIEIANMINKHIHKKIRSSVLSLENLISRFLAGLFIFFAGYIVGLWSFQGFSVFAVAWLLVAVSYFYFNKTKRC